MPAYTPFQFLQSTESTSWIVNHNLNTYPIVDVLVYDFGVLKKIIPLEILIVDMNNIEIQFSQPRSGQARLV